MLSRFWREWWDFGANVEQHSHWQQIKPLQRRIVPYRFCKFGCDVIPLLLVVSDLANMETWAEGSDRSERIERFVG
jgi:hypothetical protein